MACQKLCCGHPACWLVQSSVAYRRREIIVLLWSNLVCTCGHFPKIRLYYSVPWGDTGQRVLRQRERERGGRERERERKEGGGVRILCCMEPMIMISRNVVIFMASHMLCFHYFLILCCHPLVYSTLVWWSHNAACATATRYCVHIVYIPVSLARGHPWDRLNISFLTISIFQGKIFLLFII